MTNEELIAWHIEREENARRLAKTSNDSDGWLEDAEYYCATIAALSAQAAQPVAWNDMSPWMRDFLAKGDGFVRTLYNEPADAIRRSDTGQWIQTASAMLQRSSFAAAQPVSSPTTGGWQPISSAPKDGTTVLLWEQYSDSPVVGFYMERFGKWYADQEHYDTDGDACVVDKLIQDMLTHWQPLPLPPAPQGKEDAP